MKQLLLPESHGTSTSLFSPDLAKAPHILRSLETPAGMHCCLCSIYCRQRIALALQV